MNFGVVGGVGVGADVVAAVDDVIIIVWIDYVCEWRKYGVHLALRARRRCRWHEWSPPQAGWIDL